MNIYVASHKKSCMSEKSVGSGIFLHKWSTQEIRTLVCTDRQTCTTYTDNHVGLAQAHLVAIKNEGTLPSALAYDIIIYDT